MTCSRNTQKETTPFYPKVLIVSKLYAYWITVNYRESYGMFVQKFLIMKVLEEVKLLQEIKEFQVKRIEDCLLKFNTLIGAKDYVEMQ